MRTRREILFFSRPSQNGQFRSADRMAFLNRNVRIWFGVGGFPGSEEDAILPDVTVTDAGPRRESQEKGTKSVAHTAKGECDG